jgi:hypothetical protein
MATTYKLITSATPNGVTSLTFSSIPATYTDLVIRASVRGDAPAFIGTLLIGLNNDTGSNYSFDRMKADCGTGSITSQILTGLGFMYVQFNNAANSTVNSFAPMELLFAQYSTTSFFKQMFGLGYQTNNQGSNLDTMATQTNWWTGTSAINRIDIALQSGVYLSGTRFDLYGILKG